MRNFFFLFIFLINTLSSLEVCERHYDEDKEIRVTAAMAVDDAQLGGGDLYFHGYFVSVYDKALWEFRKCKSYSQYTHQFADFISRCKPIAHPHLHNGFHKVGSLFLKMYTNCIKDHGNILAYYERGKIYFDRGYYYDSLKDVQFIFDKGFGDELLADIKENDALLLRSKALFEICEYEEAITILSKIINRDPQNKEAYYTRAISYFETGNFELALLDYVLSDKSKMLANTQLLTSLQFYSALMQGLKDGGLVALVDFFPSLCSTAYGIGQTLWAFGSHPVNFTFDFCNACYDICNNSVDLFNTIDKSKMEDYAIEMQMLYNKFAEYGDAEKGALFGYCIGKYGLDIVATTAAVKGISYLKKIKDANRVCTMESMLLSQSNKENLTALAANQFERRQSFFNSVRLHVDKQNKHVTTAHNYIQGKSILTHPDPESLLKKFAGKGTPIQNRKIGNPDYREKVDFGEFIGYHIDKNTGIQTPTNFGEIRYSSDGGAHIVPCLE